MGNAAKRREEKQERLKEEKEKWEKTETDHIWMRLLGKPRVLGLWL